jgi:hypothetical protein
MQAGPYSTAHHGAEGQCKSRDWRLILLSQYTQTTLVDITWTTQTRQFMESCRGTVAKCEHVRWNSRHKQFIHATLVISC